MTNDSFITGVGPFDLTKIVCPSCDEVFYVDLETWHRNTLSCRPCPYCFAVSEVPREGTVN